MSFAYSDIPEQTGRTAIVTGANTGIGLEIAVCLARGGALRPPRCRQGQRSDEDIRSGLERADLAFLHLDLANIASVREAAEEASHEERIDPDRQCGRHDAAAVHATAGANCSSR